jgi:hypothetical protein
MKTCEQLCIDYAIAAAAVKATSKMISALICQRTIDYVKACEAGSQTHELPTDCIKDFFDGQSMGDDMCQACDEKHMLVRSRKIMRQKLGAAKRSIFVRGKMLNNAAPVAGERE